MPFSTQINPDQLWQLIGTPDCPAIIDVSTDEDFAAAPDLIPGAVRFAARDISALETGGREVVTVCQGGLKLSQGAAAILREKGIEAASLAGGNLGWRAGAFPMVPFAKIPTRSAEGRTAWVTRWRPKVDRIACAWLIRRFVDPSALFLFVEPSQVEGVAARFDATPFDVEGVFWSHRGEMCTFDTMVEEFGLVIEALTRLAIVVRGADTASHHLDPRCAGLLALSLGLSATCRDDIAQLAAGMIIYDSLYLWCRDAFDEGHDWQPAGTER